MDVLQSMEYPRIMGQIQGYFVKSIGNIQGYLEKTWNNPRIFYQRIIPEFEQILGLPKDVKTIDIEL
jgi:hypothetical protein